MHRDDQRRLQRSEHLHHAVEVEGVIAVDRRHDHVDAPNLVELLLRERVMKMPEMSDAHIRDLEDEDRVAVALGAAAPVANVSRHVAHAHIAVFQIPDRRLFGARSPAAQHVFDRRVGMVGVVGVMGMIHGGDIGHHRQLQIIVVIGRNADVLRAFNQEGGMTDEGDAHLIGIERRSLESSLRDERPIAGDKAGTILPHLRCRRRFRLRLWRLRRGARRGAPATSAAAKMSPANTKTGARRRLNCRLLATAPGAPWETANSHGSQGQTMAGARRFAQR